MKRSRMGIVVGCALALLGMALNASAQSPPEAVVKCETRVNPQRVKIQVNGDNIPAGMYRANVTNVATGASEPGTIIKSPDADGEVDFEFNSNPDGEAGIQAIAANFAVAGNMVSGAIVDNATGTAVPGATDTATCVLKP